MRKGRFSRVGTADGQVARRLSLASLLAFDFRAPADEDDACVAAERAHTLGVAVPLLAASHLVWSAILLGALAAAGGGTPLAMAGLLAALLVLDAALCSRIRGAAAHRIVRLTALHTAGTSAIWAAVAVMACSGPGGGSLLVRAALVAGIGTSVPAFFAVPAILVLACVATTLVAFTARVEPEVLGSGIAMGLFIGATGLLRAGEAIASARRRLVLENEAKKAGRFVADYEASGRGWFWETNADGALTYVSPQFAAQAALDSPALLGRRFEDAVLTAETAEGDARSTLEFHLSTRFPFSDLVVRAPGAGGVSWSLTGSPNFDDYGRFLGFRGLGSNLSEQKRHEAEASKLARFDSLTGLPNRAMMAKTLDDALANSADRRHGCALMLIDLDRFKQVNDTLGHPVGDKLLKQVGQRLAAAVGEQGRVGRLGGDEFEAVLPGTDEEGRLGRLAAAIIEAVSRPYEIDGHRVRVGASIGIALARPGKAYASALVKEADLALYAAKADGRGTHRFYAPEMHAEAADRQALARDLSEALERGQLHLAYQPIVESVSEEVIAFEALLRWQHPTRGLLPPAVLLPLASEAGIMPQIGAWVVRSACAEAAAWPAHVRVSVNLSPAEFADPALAATVASALSASGVDPARLELEISEEVFLADSNASEQVLARLKGLGVRLALDNFGTGHSGLGHLRNAPLDKIKIDRSFVRGASEARSRNAAIVRAIVVLAESLGIDTTAEGAETLEDLALIRRLGCSQVQGFLFGKPMDPAEAKVLAERSRPPCEAALFSRPPRHRLLRTGTLVLEDERLPVRLRNISAGGAMVECDRALPAGTPVALDLEDAGLVASEVRWSGRGELGMRFGAPFALRKLARTRNAAPPGKMLTPTYLDAAAAPPPPVPAEASPLMRKKARR